jgi:hypothetical protein
MHFEDACVQNFISEFTSLFKILKGHYYLPKRKFLLPLKTIRYD